MIEIPSSTLKAPEVLDRFRILTGAEKEEHERRWRRQIHDMPHLMARNKAVTIRRVEVFRNPGITLPLHSEGRELAPVCLRPLAIEVTKEKEPARARDSSREY